MIIPRAKRINPGVTLESTISKTKRINPGVTFESTIRKTKRINPGVTLENAIRIKSLFLYLSHTTKLQNTAK